MKETKHKLTLYQPASYQVKVPGHLDESWIDWAEKMAITVDSEDDGEPITTLVCKVDQAGLHGLLCHLYSVGIPLISVIYLKVK